MVHYGDRRHRLNADEVPLVRALVLEKLAELYEERRDLPQAEEFYRVIHRMDHNRPGRPEYPEPFTWATIEEHLSGLTREPEATAVVSKGRGPHLMRVAAVAEMLAEGYTEDQVIDRFREMDGFNERKTRYYVRHAARRGYRPFRCETITKNGGCLGPRCPIYKGPLAPSQEQEVTAR